MTDVLIGDVLLSGSVAAPGAFGFSGLDSWYSLPDSKAALDERSQMHGSFDPGDDWRESAKISFTGYFEGETRQDVLAAKRRLTRLGLTRGRTRVVVTDEDGPSWRDVSVRFVDVDDDRGGLIFTFSVDMISPDPFRYGDAVVDTTGLPVAGSGLVWPLGTAGVWLNWGTTGDLGRVETPNDGTGDTYSLLDVTGGMSLGFLLTYVPTGQLISFDREVPVGSTITIDTRKGIALIDGQSDVTGFLTISDWWAVPAGDIGSVQFASKGVVTGTPTLTARTAPAYI